MTRREAIEALEYLISGECTDTQMDYVAEIQMAIDDMKTCEANNPRVLTLKEVRDNCPDYVYVETKTGWLECTIQDCGESDKWDGFFVYGIDEYFMESWDIYGKWWRCWSAKPTEEQRKGAGWDAD